MEAVAATGAAAEAAAATAAAATATGTAAAGTAQTQTHKQTNDEIFEVYSKEDVRRLKKKIKCSIIQRKEGQSRLEVSS